MASASILSIIQIARIWYKFQPSKVLHLVKSYLRSGTFQFKMPPLKSSIGGLLLCLYFHLIVSDLVLTDSYTFEYNDEKLRELSDNILYHYSAASLTISNVSKRVNNVSWGRSDSAPVHFIQNYHHKFLVLPGQFIPEKYLMPETPKLAILSCDAQYYDKLAFFATDYDEFLAFYQCLGDTKIIDTNAVELHIEVLILQKSQKLSVYQDIMVTVYDCFNDMQNIFALDTNISRFCDGPDFFMKSCLPVEFELFRFRDHLMLIAISGVILILSGGYCCISNIKDKWSNEMRVMPGMPFNWNVLMRICFMLWSKYIIWSEITWMVFIVSRVSPPIPLVTFFGQLQLPRESSKDDLIWKEVWMV